MGLLNRAQKIRDKDLLPYLPVPWRSPPYGELYGISADYEAVRELNVYLKKAVLHQDWFKLVFKRPWWWWLLHPIRGRSIRRWVFATEVALRKEMDTINFYERMRKVMFESAEYGTSPAAAAVKEFKIMEEANMYQDIIKHGLPRREKP